MPARKRPVVRKNTVARLTERRKQPKASLEPPKRLLLDTHTFLWFVSGNERLSTKARRAIENPANAVYISAASVWEIAIKRQIGRLPESARFTPTLGAYLKHHGFSELAMTVEHAEVAGELPAHHRDPFDRMLIAQARCEAMTLISNEALFDSYNVIRLW